MHKIKSIEIFKIGTIASSDGDIDNYDLADLQQIVSTFNIKVHQPPIIWGHSADTNWSSWTPNSSVLANGWVTKVWAENGVLMADIAVDKETKQMLVEEKLKKVSIGLYPKEHPSNPVPGQLTLRHLALLGSEPPAVKSLAPIKIYTELITMPENIENNADTIEKAADWLAFALNNEGEGFTGEIIGFEPAPTKENNWLYNAEKEEFAGVFVDSDNRSYDFVINKSTDGWDIAYKMTAETADSIEGDATDESKFNDGNCATCGGDCNGDCNSDCNSDCNGDCHGECAKKYEDTEEMETPEEEKENPLAEQVRQLQAKLEEYKAKEQAAMYSETNQFCDEMYSSGKLDESMIKRESLAQIINALQMVQSLTYSENEQTLAVAPAIKNLLRQLPAKAQFSEEVIARKQQVAKYDLPPRLKGRVDADSENEYNTIKAYMQENNIQNFAQARREMIMAKGKIV